MEKWLNDCISSRRAECWPGREGLPPQLAWYCRIRLGRQPLDPTQAIFGTAGGPILAADPPRIAQSVDQAEQIAVVQLPVVRLVTVGSAGDLDMTDAVQMGPQLDRNVSFRHLYMIEIHLHLQIRFADLAADGMGLRLVVEEEAGHVARIQGLDGAGAAWPSTGGARRLRNASQTSRPLLFQ